MKNSVFLFLIIIVNIGYPCGDAPASQETVVTVQPYLSQNKIRPGDMVDLLVRFAIGGEYHINAHTPLEDFYIPTELSLEEHDWLRMSTISYPEAELKQFAFSEAPLAVYEGENFIKAQLSIGETIELGQVQLSGALHYQACSEEACLAPEEVSFSLSIEVVAKGAEISQRHEELFSQHEFNAKEQEVDSDITFTADELRAKEILERGLPYALIAFFVLGLALNLTPCVYPVLPITVSFFGGRSAENKTAGFFSALLYVFGIAIVFSALGLISGLAGKQWGFLFQNAWFTAVIALIILSMAASMFGAFEIVVPSWLLTKMGGAREGAVGAFIMGLTVGVVIAPCAAGIIIGLVGLVAKLGIVVKGAILFFMMGLGLGLPYLILGTFSSLLTKLPQSGMWMIWIRKLFGVLLVGVALYFLLPQAQRVYDQLGFFLGILIIFGGTLLGFLDHAPGYSKAFKKGRAVFGVVVVLLGIFVFNNALSSKESTIEWIDYRNQPLSEFTERGKPVFLDFYADWCAPCKQMERTTFRDDDVSSIAKNYVMVKINCSSPTPSIRAFMEQFKVVGMPTYIFLDSSGAELPGLREIGYIAPAQFAEKLQSAL